MRTWSFAFSLVLVAGFSGSLALASTVEPANETLPTEQHDETLQKVIEESNASMIEENPAEYQLTHMNEAVTADPSRVNRSPAILAPPVYETQESKNMFLDYTDEIPQQAPEAGF